MRHDDDKLAAAEMYLYANRRAAERRDRPGIELAGPVDRLRSSLINGIKRMPVVFTPERQRRVVGG